MLGSQGSRHCVEEGGGGGEEVAYSGVLRMLSSTEQLHLLNHSRDVLAKRPEDDGELPLLQGPQKKLVSAKPCRFAPWSHSTDIQSDNSLVHYICISTRATWKG